jgi:hypothetical protein
MNKNNEVLTFDGGNVYMWIEQNSSIMLKAAVKEFNDPVELTSEEARLIAKSILTLAEQLDNQNDFIDNK